MKEVIYTRKHEFSKRVKNTLKVYSPEVMQNRGRIAVSAAKAFHLRLHRQDKE